MTEEYAIPTKTNKVHVIREGIIVTRAEVLVRQFLKGSSVVVNIPAVSTNVGLLGGKAHRKSGYISR